MDTTQLDLFPDDTISAAATRVPKLVALSGRAGSGKSLASKTLINAGWKRVKFADCLKNMLRSLYLTAGLEFTEIERRIEGDLKEKPDPYLQGKTPRHAMQTLGNEWGRELIRPNLWMSLTAKAIRKALHEGYNVVVDDCRYPNEAERISAMGGRVYLIDRVQGVQGLSDHPSERFDFEPHGVIYNTGTEIDLCDTIRDRFL